MARLELVENEKVVEVWDLAAQETLIGRERGCGVHLANPAVSRRHARVVRMYGDYYLEDLGSTNGVSLNARRIRKHLLKDGDILQITPFRLRFVATPADSEINEKDPDKTLVLRRSPSRTVPPARPQKACVRYIEGERQGEIRGIEQGLFTVGTPGSELAVISRRANGYFLLHLGGRQVTRLNGKKIQGGGVRLSSGDHIQVGDTRLEFFFAADLPNADSDLPAQAPA